MSNGNPSAQAGEEPASDARASAQGDRELDRLVEAERIKAAFLASLSHEFRTPLNVVLGYLDLLEEAATAEEARDLRALIRRHAGSMLAMLDNTLYLADLRLERVVLAPELVTLRPLLEGVVRETEVLWGRPEVALEILLGDGVDEVRVDKRALRQVVRNLLGNALCFTEKGRVLLQLVASSADDMVEIRVADTGPGISVLDRARLFDEYSALRTDAPGRYNAGLGIGLPVAKQLAILIGGSLEIESAPGWRSVFRFCFPRRGPVPGESTPRAPAGVLDPEPAARSAGAPRVAAARGRPRCPPFPAILGLIARALREPAADDRDVRRAVQSDEALSLTLLNYVNRASVPRMRPVQTIGDALGVVGLTGVRTIVLTKFVHSLFTRWSAAEEFLWEHALASALAAPQLHAAGGPPPDDFYLCGLLHNLGKVLLNAEDPTRYADVLMCVSQCGQDFCQAEHEAFGIAHPAFGSELARDAGIPETVKQVVGHHHDSAIDDPTIAALSRTVLLADAVAYRVSPAWAAIQGDAAEPPWITARLARLEEMLTPEAFATLVASVHGELEEMRALLRC